jgi:single-stranded DNA-binding protein
MSLFLLATGPLLSDPVRRTARSGEDYATATVRVATDGADSILVSVIGFKGCAEQLLAHHQGSTLAISGRAKMTSWVGKDGSPKTGLSVVVEQIASASSARRADVARRRDRATPRRQRSATAPAATSPPLSDGLDDLWQPDREVEREHADA